MFKIYIDRLRHENEQEISLTVLPEFLEIAEKELLFDAPINISGKAGMAADFIILRLDITTSCQQVCAICNRLRARLIDLKNVSYNIPVEELRGAVFDYRDLVREAILINTPPFFECNNGHCSERPNIAKYMKKPKEQEAIFPFRNLF